MNGVPKQWGPHIGPPPFAPPFAPDFDEWYQREKADRGGTYGRVDAYVEFYNLAGDPDDWARLGYSADPPTASPPPSGNSVTSSPNAALHSALRRAVGRHTDADLAELDAEVAAAVQQTS